MDFIYLVHKLVCITAQKGRSEPKLIKPISINPFWWPKPLTSAGPRNRQKKDPHHAICSFINVDANFSSILHTKN